MNALQDSARRVVAVLRAADRLFALPPLASSLLPAMVREGADAVLRARTVDEALDAIDRMVSDPDFLPSLMPWPRALERDQQGELSRLAHVLGDEAATIAAVGLDRALVAAGLLAMVRDQERDQLRASANRSVRASLMDVACEDGPVEISEAVLAFGRGLVSWLVILRADERGHSVPSCLCEFLARMFAGMVYPGLRLAASFYPVPEDVVPAADRVNVADAFRRWEAARQEAEHAAELACNTGEGMCGTGALGGGP